VTEPKPTLSPASPHGLRRYKRHWHHVKQARWHLAGGLLSGVVYAACTGAGLPAVMKYLLPIFFDKKDEINPQVVSFARALFGDGYLDGLLVLACLGLPLMFLIRGLASIANRYLINQAGFIVLESLRLEAYSRLLALPLAFYQRNKAGDLSARLMGDTDKVKAVIVNVSSDIVTQPLTLVSSLAYLIYLSYNNHSALFAMVAMISVPLCVVPIRMTARRLVKRSRQLAEKGGELSSAAIETLQSPLEIQAYNLQTRQRDRFITQIREIFGLSMKTIKYQAVVTPAIEVISVCGFVAALYFGTKNGMTFPVFVSLATALFLAYGPVKKLSSVQALIKTGEASLDRLEYILDAEDTVPPPAVPRPLPKVPLEFAFENVSFAYEKRPGEPSSTSRPVEALIEINLRAKPGETIALVGASGAGKSTFITLLPRFFDPTSGRITLGGIDLRDLDKAELRDRIAVVPQQPLLFNASLAENIRLGRAGATDEEVVQAARRAHVHDFIASLPHGYATMVGERGNSLSGGQRQRIAIARAFLKDAPILVLDEATSALDSESEAMVQAALKELVQGRTTFMIAHRFSSIRDASRILVFEQGRLIADGPHATIYTSSPIYRSLYDKQSSATAAN
jgi:subfamily B ATP-binding cassette protein MsbA